MAVARFTTDQNLTEHPGEGSVVAIGIARAAGAPLESVEQIAVDLAGLRGDRYASGAGHWSYHPPYVSAVTFIDEAVIARVAAALGKTFVPFDLRRNVITRDVDLLALIGAEFVVGAVVFAGDRACDPCGYLDGLLAAPVKAALGPNGGLRANVIRPGTLTVGDRISRF